MIPFVITLIMASALVTTSFASNYTNPLQYCDVSTTSTALPQYYYKPLYLLDTMKIERSIIKQELATIKKGLLSSITETDPKKVDGKRLQTLIANAELTQKRIEFKNIINEIRIKNTIDHSKKTQ